MQTADPILEALHKMGPWMSAVLVVLTPAGPFPTNVTTGSGEPDELKGSRRFGGGRVEKCQASIGCTVTRHLPTLHRVGHATGSLCGLHGPPEGCLGNLAGASAGVGTWGTRPAPPLSDSR